MRKLMLVLTVAGLWTVNAKTGLKSYSVSIPEKCVVGAAQLKPGEYRVKIDGSVAIFSDNETNRVTKAPVTVTTAETKFEHNEVFLHKAPDNSERLTEIELQGTKLKLDFPDQP